MHLVKSITLIAWSGSNWHSLPKKIVKVEFSWIVLSKRSRVKIVMISRSSSPPTSLTLTCFSVDLISTTLPSVCTRVPKSSLSDIRLSKLVSGKDGFSWYGENLIAEPWLIETSTLSLVTRKFSLAVMTKPLVTFRSHPTISFLDYNLAKLPQKFNLIKWEPTASNRPN